MLMIIKKIANVHLAPSARGEHLQIHEGPGSTLCLKPLSQREVQLLTPSIYPPWREIRCRQHLCDKDLSNPAWSSVLMGEKLEPYFLNRECEETQLAILEQLTLQQLVAKIT